jgi:hypothetical protein
LFYVVILNAVKNPRISSFDSICPLNHFVCFTNANVNLFFPKTLSKSPCQARKPLISLIANDIELAKYPKQTRIINVEENLQREGIGGAQLQPRHQDQSVLLKGTGSPVP